MKQRCKWCNLNNQLYVDYHDNEWCQKNFDDKYLFEMLILESFQAGLSWECILNKRKYFKEAYDNFNIDKIINYDEEKIFKQITNEYKTFYNYLKTFTNDKTLYEINNTRNNLSDAISKDLKKRGMSFIGTTIIYSYLQAIGIIYSHDKQCFMYKEK